MAQYRTQEIEQGAFWELYINATDQYGSPIDLTDYTASMVAKKSYTSIDKVTFNCEITDAIKGEIHAYMSSQDTKNMKPIRYVYEMIIKHEPTGHTVRLLEGIITVTPTLH